MNKEYCDARLERIEGLLDSIHKAVYGNGSVGIKDQVALNTEFRVRASGIIDGLILKILGLIIGIMGLTGGLVWVIIKHG